MNIIAGSANSDNLKQSILNPVDYRLFQDCPQEILDKINQNYSNKNNIYLWALSTTGKYDKLFNNIANGDIILLKENKQKERKYFNYYGEILFKTELCENVGKNIWNSEIWNKLLFLTNIKNIKIEDKLVSKYFGIDENFDYPRTLLRKIDSNNKLLEIIKDQIQKN